jgi:hypothetical protein
MSNLSDFTDKELLKEKKRIDELIKNYKPGFGSGKSIHYSDCLRNLTNIICEMKKRRMI